MSEAKHWVVTGASRGIGLELVKQLLESDEQVTAMARNTPSARTLQALVLEYPARLRVVEGDVTKDLELDRAVKVLNGEKVDVLINNAGVYQKGDGDFRSIDPKIVEQTFLVNALGPIKVTKAFLPLLTKAPQPVVANMASLMGSISDNTSGGSIAYRMSKAALNMFTKNLSHEFDRAIVLSLHPGWVKTDMGGSGATIEIADSAKGLLKVIRQATPEVSGRFFNFKGEALPW